jgi:hypothetical protein
MPCYVGVSQWFSVHWENRRMDAFGLVGVDEQLEFFARQALTQQQNTEPRTGPQSFYGLPQCA